MTSLEFDSRVPEKNAHKCVLHICNLHPGAFFGLVNAIAYM